MGTSNFYNKNANCVYSNTIEDDLTLHDVRENVSCELEAIAKSKRYNYSEDDSLEIAEELRSFPSRSIGALNDGFDFLGFWIEVTITAQSTSGYYEGFNLDYDIEVVVEMEDFFHSMSNEDNWDFLMNDIVEFSNVNRGLLAIHRNRFIKKIQEMIKELSEVTEGIYKDNSDKLEVVAQFCNGETIYGACESSAA